MDELVGTTRSISAVGGAGVATQRKNVLVTSALGLTSTIATKPLEDVRSPGPRYMVKWDAVTHKDPTVKFGTGRRQESSKSAAATPGPSFFVDEPKRLAPIRLGSRTAFGSLEGLKKSATALTLSPPAPKKEDADPLARSKPPANAITLKGRPKERAPLPKPPPMAKSASAAADLSSFAKPSFTDNITNPPSVKFGKPPKPRRLSKEASAVFAAPGPLEYDVDRGYKKISTIKVPPKFSLVPRRPAGGVRIGPPAPIPAFHKPIEGIGKQALSEKKTAPSVSLAGRTKFGSPYG